MADPAAENGMVFIPALGGEALAPAFLPADHLSIPVVPAAGPLAEVPAHRSDVPELRSRKRPGGFAQARIIPLDHRVGRQDCDRRQRPDTDSRFIFLDRSQPGDGLEVDDQVGLDDSFLDLGENQCPPP